MLRTGLIVRCFYTAFTDLTAQLPWRFGGRLSATFEGQDVLALEGGRLASGSDDGTIKIWELASGACVATLAGHGGFGHLKAVWSLAVLDDGRLASGSWDQTIKIWDVGTGACVATLKGHEHWVSSLAVLEGGRLASGSDDRRIKIWDSAIPDILRRVH